MRAWTRALGSSALRLPAWACCPGAERSRSRPGGFLPRGRKPRMLSRPWKLALRRTSSRASTGTSTTTPRCMTLPLATETSSRCGPWGRGIAWDRLACTSRAMLAPALAPSCTRGHGSWQPPLAAAGAAACAWWLDPCPPSQEVDFLFNLTEERLDEEPMSALELGAGPARHSIELAKRGLQVTALELNPHMVEYAQGRAAAEKVSVNFIEGDMRGFQVPQPGGGFDMVLILLGSLNHLLDNQAVVDCFKSAAAVLSPKGTMVVEVGHPQDLWDGQVMQELGDAWENEQDGSTVLVEWGREGDGFDPVTQVLARTVGLTRFNDADEIVSVTQTTVPQRLFSAQELDALARASGLKVDAMYGDMNQDVDIYHDEALRMVLVMSRDEGA
mmetsp:Transcript_65801/g.208253  ORF Transcript_65801/g.208253 Transcript_65801/m.208253 type:complete len:387 (-) Transcript_65801:43-1203(-)